MLDCADALIKAQRPSDPQAGTSDQAGRPKKHRPCQTAKGTLTDWLIQIMLHLFFEMPSIYLFLMMQMERKQIQLDLGLSEIQ